MLWSACLSGVAGASLESDQIYFSRRGSEERAAATRAADARARQAHLELADRYDELASAIRSTHPVEDIAHTG